MPALSIGVRLEQYSDGNCGTGIEPSLNMNAQGCNTWSTAVCLPSPFLPMSCRLHPNLLPLSSPVPIYVSWWTP